MEEIIGYECHSSNGDGSISVWKFKTYESAKTWLDADMNSPYYEGPTDAGPYPVYLSSYKDQIYGEY